MAVATRTCLLPVTSPSGNCRSEHVDASLNQSDGNLADPIENFFNPLINLKFRLNIQSENVNVALPFKKIVPQCLNKPLEKLLHVLHVYSQYLFFLSQGVTEKKRRPKRRSRDSTRRRRSRDAPRPARHRRRPSIRRR